MPHLKDTEREEFCPVLIGKDKVKWGCYARRRETQSMLGFQS